MKKFAIIFILLLGFQLVSGQDFKRSTEYKIITGMQENGNDLPNYVVSLVPSGDVTNKISTLTIEDTELFEDIFISTLENPGLEGISKVIKMEVEYLACCAHVEAFYFLVGNDNTITALPKLENVYCENSDKDYQYTFPSQKYGEKNNILKTQTFYTPNAGVKYVNTKQSYGWKNNTFFPANSTAITAK